MIDGILIIDKPAGMTSHDVVAKVRRALKQRRVGHTGTLDPFATGVLPVCVGQATRLSRFLQGEGKTYQAEMQFGCETDTLDVDGDVVARHPLPETLEASALEAVLGRYRGEIEQTPPMYSALKHKGRPLYEYARAGVRIERPKRRVTIQSLSVLDIRWPRVRFEVTCSSGTYIRVLAADIGRDLGVGAHVTALRRIRVGGFREEDAIPLEHIERGLEAVSEWMLPPEAALPGAPVIELNAEESTWVGHGRAFWRSGRDLVIHGTDGGDGSMPSVGDQIRLKTSGVFKALGRIVAVDDERRKVKIHPHIVFS